MSAFVLNRQYELQLPSSYVDIDREEMEYVDGGFYLSREWYGTAIHLNEGDLDAIVDVMYGAAWAGVTFSGYCWMIAEGCAPFTFGMSVALAGSLAAISAFSSAVVGLGAYTLSHLDSLVVPLWGVLI